MSEELQIASSVLNNRLPSDDKQTPERNTAFTLYHQAMRYLVMVGHPSMHSIKDLKKQEETIHTAWKDMGRKKPEEVVATVESMAKALPPYMALTILSATPIEQMNFTREQKQELAKLAYDLLMKNTERGQVTDEKVMEHFTNHYGMIQDATHSYMEQSNKNEIMTQSPGGLVNMAFMKDKDYLEYSVQTLTILRGLSKRGLLSTELFAAEKDIQSVRGSVTNIIRHALDSQIHLRRDGRTKAIQKIHNLVIPVGNTSNIDLHLFSNIRERLVVLLGIMPFSSQYSKGTLPLSLQQLFIGEFPSRMNGLDYRLNWHLDKDSMSTVTPILAQAIFDGLLKGLPLTVKITSSDPPDITNGVAYQDRFCIYTDYDSAQFLIQAIARNPQFKGQLKPEVAAARNSVLLYPFGKESPLYLRSTGESDAADVDKNAVMADFTTLSASLKK